MKNTPNYYAIIPADVRYDENLKDKAKLLYGEITSLSDKYGYCYASNKYFAELYNVSTRTISELIATLVKQNYIQIKFEYKKDTKQILQRKIYLWKKTSIPIENYFYTPIEENFQDNNTSMNNINKNIKEYKENIKESKVIDMEFIENYDWINDN